MSRILYPTQLAQSSVKKQAAYTKEDFLKTRLIFRLVFLIALVAILSLFYIWSQVQIVQYGYEINLLKLKQRRLLEENKKVKLEVSSLKSPTRLEKIAREKLKMNPVQVEQVRSLR